jgi:hypothetical protein
MAHKKHLGDSDLNVSGISLLAVIAFVLIMLYSFGCKNEGSSRVDDKVAPIPAPAPAPAPAPVNVDDMVRGRIGYVIPDPMDEEKSYLATATITKSQTDSVLLKNIDPTSAQKEEINVSSRMKVRLLDPTGGESFKITALSSEEQFVSAEDNTIWRWNVIPLNSGEHTLRLVAVATIFDSKGKSDKDIEVFNRTFTVRSAPFLKTASKFVSDNWQWFAGTIAIPLLLYLFSSIRKKKKEEDKTKD